MTKIDLITGILGSGKTTFLMKYAKHLIDKGMKIAILENDFGAVNVDMMLLQELKCDNCQLEMVAGGGDPCCHKRRFKTQLISLGMQNFDRVIVEPSGIFDMDEFFDTLHESPLDRWFEIGSIITIIDAETDEKLPEQMEYLFGSEAACCGKLVLSKRSSFPDESDEHISERLITHLNNSLEDIKCDRRFSPRDIFNPQNDVFSDDDFSMLMSAGYRGSSYIKKFSGDDIISGVHYFMHIAVDKEMLPKLIDDIFNDDNCGNIMRIKGSVPDYPDGWIKINATREKTELSHVREGQSVIITIGEHLRREQIDSHILRYNTDTGFVSI